MQMYTPFSDDHNIRMKSHIGGKIGKRIRYGKMCAKKKKKKRIICQFLHKLNNERLFVLKIHYLT